MVELVSTSNQTDINEGLILSVNEPPWESYE